MIPTRCRDISGGPRPSVHSAHIVRVASPTDPRRPSVAARLRASSRPLTTLVVSLMLANGLVLVSREFDAPTTAGASPIAAGPGNLAGGAPGDPAQPGGAHPFELVQPGGDDDTPATGIVGGRPGVRPSLRSTIPPGVTDTTIDVAYYWKGERTQTSPYLGGTGAEGQNLDESLAFERYIEFINKHDGDGTTFMGVPIELHGRRLRGRVVAPKGNANGGYAYGQMAEEIAAEIKPFAAIASHGGLSTYVCPRLAEAGIHNLSTYDLGGLGGSLVKRTDGYCMPAGLSWERQVQESATYLARTKNVKTTAGETPVYGVIYTVYPGLSQVGPAMVKKLRAAGLNIQEVARLPDDLATSQQQAPFIISRMRSKGVNTLIMPDAGAPLNITHAAQAAQYSPDYFVWPCSGTDVTAMVRLYNAAQWTRASGLTCYDREFNPDLTNTDKAQATEWWQTYQEMAPGREPPAQSPLIYASLAQLLAGIRGAGPVLTVESFRAGLSKMRSYRYDAIDGRTTDATNMLLTFGESDRSMIGDAAFLRWDALSREAGGAQGRYVYPEDRRYRSRS